LLRANIEVPRTDAQDFPALEPYLAVACALDRQDRADLHIGLEPVLDRLGGLIVIG
jgi:hypothetical protein